MSILKEQRQGQMALPFLLIIWKSAGERKPFTLFSIAICIFAKKECGSELGRKRKLIPSYQKGPINFNKFLSKEVNSCKHLSLA
jgi:hypothetical protein